MKTFMKTSVIKFGFRIVIGAGPASLLNDGLNNGNFQKLFEYLLTAASVSYKNSCS